MRVTIEMDNGLMGCVEIDEMLLDRMYNPIEVAINHARPMLEDCVNRRNQKRPPMAGGVEDTTE